MKKYKLIAQTDDYDWLENTGEPMEIGRIVSEDEIINDHPMKYWIIGQEEYWEEITPISDIANHLKAEEEYYSKSNKLSNKLADELLKERLELIKKSLLIKAKEYVRNDDRMHNFNQAAIKSGLTREEALAGFRLKHEVSVDDMRNDIKEGKLPTEEIVREKFGDIINYYILEEMSILHRIKKENNK